MLKVLITESDAGLRLMEVACLQEEVDQGLQIVHHFETIGPDEFELADTDTIEIPTKKRSEVVSPRSPAA